MLPTDLSSMELLASTWLQWQFIAFASLMIATGFAAIVYMLGQLLGSEKMSAFAKLEFAEIIYSAILIVSILWILGMATGALEGLIGGIYPHGLGTTICGGTYDSYFGGDENFPCHLRVARVYLDTLYAEGKEFNYELLSAHMWYSFFQGFHFTGDFHEHASGTVNFSPMGSLFSLPSSVYSYMFEFGMRSMLIVRFQAFFINFINYALYPVLLMLGLILRTFPFARRIGGLLMAIAISLYFVFPMFYVVGGYMFENIRENVECEGSAPGQCPVIAAVHFNPDTFYEGIELVADDPNGASEVEEIEPPEIGTGEFEYLYRGTDTYCDTENQGWEGIGDTLLNLGRSSIFAADFTTLLSSEEYMDSILGPGGVIDATARFTFFSMFFALLSIFSTIGAIRSLSPIFGGDIELAGLTHLI
jgi:hypothetical protein